MERAKRQNLGQPFGLGDDGGITLKVLVSNKLVGGVIGKAGATINAIKDASGAKVKVSIDLELAQIIFIWRDINVEILRYQTTQRLFPERLTGSSC